MAWPKKKKIMWTLLYKTGKSELPVWKEVSPIEGAVYNQAGCALQNSAGHHLQEQQCDSVMKINHPFGEGIPFEKESPPGRMHCVRMAHGCVLRCVWLFATPWTRTHHAPLSVRFLRQEYWSDLPFPSPGDLPDPGIEPAPPVSFALAA